MAARRRLTMSAIGAAFALASGETAADENAPVIWYRSSEGCPDGNAFLARLRGKGSAARLAEVNDRIDFVVTLGQGRGASSGKLERQTAGSTVAIREVQAESCDEAADVLALTLTLALNPDSGPPPESLNPAPVTPLEETRSTEPSPPPSAGVMASRSGPPGEPPAAESRERAAPKASARWLLGAELGATSGPTGALGPWGGLFVENEPGLVALPFASARLTAFAARVDDSDAGFVFTTVSGRLSACPIGFGTPTLHVNPCLGIELGLSVAEGSSSDGRTDTGVWSAASGAGRVSWAVSSSFELGLSAGAYLPLVRYTFSSEAGSELDRADPIGFFGAVAAAASLP